MHLHPLRMDATVSCMTVQRAMLLSCALFPDPLGQFFHPNVALDEVRKMLILPGKEPVPIQRKPLWAFMEREVGDSTNFCWAAMNPGYQGEGLIDGSYFDYLVDDVLSTEFKFKKL